MTPSTEPDREVVVRVAAIEDADALAALARRTFLETFVDGFALPYSEADLAEFLPRAFSPDRFAARIADAETRVWAAAERDRLIGYAVAGLCALPHADARSGDGELKNLYVAREAQGRGVGKALLDAALAWLERDGPRPLWIGVWSGNLRAQAVYAARGFAKVGEYGFPVGATVDREFILRRG